MITRKDLEPGDQLAQSLHAGIDFQHEWPDTAKQWKVESNSIVSLCTTDEQSLFKLAETFKTKGWIFNEFREPDMDDQLTSLCIYGSPEVRRFLSYLPLTFKKSKQHENV